jgi:hypothetical protein
MNLEAVCAYCAEEKLKDNDPPEHVVPRAIGGSFVVRTVCHDCNSWASREIDQPFLQDPFVMALRSHHDVRDPQSRRRARVRNPMFKGHTAAGSYAWMDEDGQPHVQGRIVRDESGERYQVHASTDAEAERLISRLEREAAAEGKQLERREVRRSKEQVTIKAELSISLEVWPRLGAKIALATGSHVFPPAWRLSPEATDLRRVLHGESSELLGDKPYALPQPIDEPLTFLVEPPEHLVCFQSDSGGQVLLFVVLFGQKAFAMPVASSDESLPEVAWRLDPRRPNSDGETTFYELLEPYIRRMALDADGQPIGPDKT